MATKYDPPLQRYLTTHGYADPVILSGGFSNFVYLVDAIPSNPVSAIAVQARLPSAPTSLPSTVNPGDDTTVNGEQRRPRQELRIIKYSAPFLKAMPSVPFSVSRLQYEHRALTVLPPLLDQSTNVAVAAVYDFSSEDNVLLLSDCGPQTLKELLLDVNASTDSSNHSSAPDTNGYAAIDLQATGTRLGTWLASLHNNTPAWSDEEKNRFHNEHGSKMVRYLIYGRPADIAAERGASEETVKFWRDVTAEFGERMSTTVPAWGVIHGDFWPGNILVKTDETSTEPGLTVVDWEVCRLGSGATDVAQFAAESFLLARFKSPHIIVLLNSFIRSYKKARTAKTGLPNGALSNDWWTEVAVHFGAHLFVWIRKWGDKEQVADVERLAESIVRSAVDGKIHEIVDEMFSGEYSYHRPSR